MTAIFLDNNDALFLFGNNRNNPYAFRDFNDIMRQYYDSNGIPIKQRQQTNENTGQNENREIVSSVQPTNTNTKTTSNTTTRERDTLTLDLLLPKSSSSYSYPSYRMKEAGDRREVLASEHQRKGNGRGSKDNFDIRDYISHVYGNRQQPQQRQRHQENNNSNKLTLAHFLNAREKGKSRTFIFAKEPDY